MNDTKKLLDLLKIHLMIEFDESDNRLKKIIENAIPDLQEKIGSSIDFLKSGSTQTFFLNYCKYCYFGQEHSFFETYANEFLQLRDIYSIKETEESEEKNES